MFYLSKRLLMKPYFDPVIFLPSTQLQPWDIPYNTHYVRVDCAAAAGRTGNAPGGAGGRVQAVLDVTGLQKLYVFVGSVPSSAAASYNASDIRTNGAGVTDTTSLNSRLIVAGGGGGGGQGANQGNGVGGKGGGLVGGTGGETWNSGPGGGGTQTAGGAAGVSPVSGQDGLAGSYPLGGSGGGTGYGNIAGTGGAGWYGGGGGSAGVLINTFYTGAAGGGGGSSYTHPTKCTEVVHTQGYAAGAGLVTISLIGWW